jgi:hypothetical protein
MEALLVHYSLVLWTHISNKMGVMTARVFLGHPWVCVDGVAPDRPLDSAVLSWLKQLSTMNKLKKMALRVSADISFLFCNISKLLCIFFTCPCL